MIYALGIKKKWIAQFLSAQHISPKVLKKRPWPWLYWMFNGWTDYSTQILPQLYHLFTTINEQSFPLFYITGLTKVSPIYTSQSPV